MLNINLSARMVKNSPVKIACDFVKLSEDKVGSKMGTTLQIEAANKFLLLYLLYDKNAASPHCLSHHEGY